MYPKGVIYQSDRSKVFGEARLRPTIGKRVAYNLLRGIGAGFVAFAIVGIIFSFWPVVQEEINYNFFRPRPATSKFGDILLRASAENQEKIDVETKALGINSYFSLSIPVLDAHANIIPNVDAGNPDAYLPALMEGVAHAKGTNFPGGGKTIFLFSHSTNSPLNFARYNAVFYLLGKLEKGDRITVYFVGRRFTYQVTDKIITGATDTSWLTDKGDGERLILQTCDPPGTSWNRLLVIAKPI